MKTGKFQYITIALLTIAWINPALADNKNEELIIFMNVYMAGHVNTGLLPPLFSKKAKVEGIRDGQFIQFTAQEFLERSKNVKPSKYSGRNHYRILESNNNTAVAMANIYVENNCFTDYLTMIRFEGLWKIIYKSFSDDCKKN